MVAYCGTLVAYGVIKRDEGDLLGERQGRYRFVYDLFCWMKIIVVVYCRDFDGLAYEVVQGQV